MTFNFKSPSQFKQELVEKLREKCVTTLEERKLVVKVNAKGARRKKVLCGPGKKWDGTKCVVQSSSEKLSIKKAHRKASKTKKAKGAGAARRTSRLRNRALSKRKGQGL